MNRLFLFALTVLLATTSPVLAQKSLRWELTAGDQFQVTVNEQKTSHITIASKPVKMTMDITLEMQWRIDSADDKQIKLTQSVKRFAVKMQTGDSPAIAYDSAVKAAPVGAAKDIAAAINPLLEEEATLLVTMSTRGEVLTAEPSEKLAKHWKSPGKKEAGGAGGSEAPQDLLKRSLVILPEKAVAAVDGGKEKWSSEREVDFSIGKVKQATEFVYAGEVEEAGRKLDKIGFSSTLTLAPDGTKNLKLTLKKQEQTGHALFSAELGRVVSAEQTQKLFTESPYRETTITVAVESTVKTVISSVKK